MADLKLYIYDSSSSLDRKQAAGRFSGDSGVVTLGVGSVAELQVGLDQLTTQGQTFNRLLFQTHGNSGMIFFNHAAITAGNLLASFLGKGYETIFPHRTKVYFDGCNVAEGKAGWDFLAAAGEVFLRMQGGITMGYTSLGAGLPGWIPWKGGHTVHLWGDLKVIEFASAAVESARHTTDGAGLFELAKISAKLNAF
jgi:hypothetical protein